MKVLKIDQTNDLAKKAKAYQEKFNQRYNAKTDELTPLYQLLDTEGNPVIKQEKKYDPAEEKTVIVKTPVIFTQFQINSYRKMGQKIEIVTQEDLEKEKEYINKLVQEAFEKGKKEGLKNNK